MPSSKALELAQASATIYQNYTNQLAEVGQALSTELLSDAASVSAATDQDYAERQTNAEIIKGIRCLLPLSELSFRTSDPLEWHKIKSTVIYGEEYVLKPLYPIGIRNEKEQPDSIMLISARQYDEPIPIKRRVAPKVSAAIDLLTQSMLDTPPSRLEIEAAYDPEKREYVLDKDSLGVIKAVERWKSSSLFTSVKFINNALIGSVRNSDLLRVPRVLKRGEICMWDDDENLVNRFDEIGPNDRDMAEYGVFSRLGALAALFGFTEKYQTILEQAKKGDKIEPQGDATRSLAAQDPTLYNGGDLR